VSLAAILSLALGIGANTTIFTWVQAVLFRKPIPGAAEPNRILIPAMTSRKDARARGPIKLRLPRSVDARLRRAGRHDAQHRR
jgi:hypothetical protein